MKSLKRRRETPPIPFERVWQEDPTEAVENVGRLAAPSGFLMEGKNKAQRDKVAGFLAAGS